MRPRVAGLLVVVQLAVPTVALASGVPSRFGFHMFSGHEETLVVQVLDRDGHEMLIDLDDYVASGRGEIGWAGRLPEFICGHNAEAGVVTVTSRGERRTVACQRR